MEFKKKHVFFQYPNRIHKGGVVIPVIFPNLP